MCRIVAFQRVHVRALKTCLPERSSIKQRTYISQRDLEYGNALHPVTFWRVWWIRPGFQFSFVAW